MTKRRRGEAFIYMLSLGAAFSRTTTAMELVGYPPVELFLRTYSVKNIDMVSFRQILMGQSTPKKIRDDVITLLMAGKNHG